MRRGCCCWGNCCYGGWRNKRMEIERGKCSIVIPTLNEGSLLHMTTNSILAASRHENLEILVVDDGSTDGSTEFYAAYWNPRVRLLRTEGRGVARARNLGAAEATGEYVVFIDGHCRVSANWLDGLMQALEDPGVAMAGPTFTKLNEPEPRGCGMHWPDYTLEPAWFLPMERARAYEVPLTTGACQAFRTRTFRALGAYEDGFTRWGFEDVEICVRAWLMGYRVVAHPGITVAHHFRESRGYEVDDVEVTYNFLRMIHMHFSGERIGKVLAALAGNPLIPEAQRRLRESDIEQVRAGLAARRRRDDDWFFSVVNPGPERRKFATAG